VCGEETSFWCSDRLPSIGETKGGTEMTGRTSAVANYSKRGKVAVTSRIEEEQKAKAYALECFACLVKEGRAQWRHGADGAELHLVTGEVYRLGENALCRII
jgi:hypothetical protein